MKSFRAKYITSMGRMKRGRIWADDFRAAQAALRAGGHYPVQITEEYVAVVGLKKFRTTLNVKDVVALLDQLEMQLDAEIPIDEALKNLAREFPDGKARFVVARILDRVSANGRIAEAFGQFPKIFPEHVVHMIDVGHQTGDLGRAFGRIVRHLEEAEQVRAAVRRAISYPLISFFVITAVTIFLVGFVLPMFGRVFKELGVPLPALTRGYLALSAFMQAHAFALVVAAIVLPLAVWSLIQLRRVKDLVDQVAARAPVCRLLVQYVAVARLAGNLGTLYDAEIPIQEAVRLCSRVSGNTVYDGAMQRAYEKIGGGSSLGDALAASRWFPGMMAHTIRVGEHSGNLGKALEKLTRYYSRRSLETVTLTLQFLEPALTIGLGVFVGSVAVSLIYPLGTLALKLK